MIPRPRNEASAFPERMRPAPHVRADGSVRPPIGTYRQEMHRATRRPPAPVRLSQRVVEALLLTLDECPGLARRLSRKLGVRS